MISNTRETWKNIWNQRYSSYVRFIPRQAYYLFFILQKEDHRILEIAAGSFRDTIRLNEWGYDCTGIDSLDEVVKMAKDQYLLYQTKMLLGDAASLNFADRSFDVTFHNGFYVLFEEDKTIDSLIREQVRVTKRYIVCTVHNKLNTRLVNLFMEKAIQDPLYDIRFFYPDEMIHLLKPYCRHVVAFPFGVPLFDRLIRYFGRYRKGVKWLYSEVATKMKLEKCERLMVVGYLS